MCEYEGMLYQLERRLDGKYCCRIYQHCIPCAIDSTSDFDKEKDAMEAAKSTIQEHRTKTDEP